MSLKICILANPLAVHTRRWATAYAERGHEVTVLSIRELEIPGVAVQAVRLGPSASESPLWLFLSYTRLLMSARRRLRRLAPDVVHAQFSVTHGVIAGWSGFHPALLSVWGSEVLRPGGRKLPWLLRRLNAFALRRADLVTATSRYLLEATKRLAPPGTDLRHVPFGVDTEAFRRAARRDPKAGFRIGFVKTLASKYGPQVLLAALPSVLRRRPDARLVLAGRGPLAERLAAQARDLGIADHVELPGFVEPQAVPELMRSFDVLVNPSLQESFGVAILEASATGLPVVAARVDGVPEVCLDGETGLLVPPGDSEALAEAIVRLAADPALAERLGRAGRHLVEERYDWGDNVDTMLAALSELAARRDERD